MNDLQDHPEDKAASTKGTTRNIVLVSVVFAAAMLIASVTIVDKSTSQTVILLLVALWLVPFLYLARARNQSSNRR